MKTQHHALMSDTPGTQHHLLSLHFGAPGSGPKVYIQASLHADEVPGMLVAHHLRQQLTALEQAGALRGEVVLVPAANPIGLSQWQLRGFQGRFAFNSGENFNRAYADLSPIVADEVLPDLGDDPQANVARVRQALRQAVARLQPDSALSHLRQTLLGLAIDADVVLDLHCDGAAVLHLYTTPQTWPTQGALLAQCLGARLALLAEHSGGDPFDEACSMVWVDLADRLSQMRGRPVALPAACLAATIELRGEMDVRHDLAEQDAQGILRFLQARGVLHSSVPLNLPPSPCEATPLAGSIPMKAPHGGMVVVRRAVGEIVRQGEPLIDVIDPLTGQLSTLCAPVDGLFFAHDCKRWAHAGMALGKVAGREALRHGALLSV